jgi:hypothetical protein
VEYQAIVEVFHGSTVVSRHMKPALTTSYSDAMANAAWQAITAWNHNHHLKMKNLVYHIVLQRKDKFKVSG